jgi:nitrite reductase (NADH) small subunit
VELAMSADPAWVDVCALDDIVPNTGVCALVGGRQIAIVRVGDGEQLHAVDNFDPFARAFVLSRGIVGDRAGVATLASPVYKQRFDLASGQCLDDVAVRIAVHPVRVRHDRVEVLAATDG